MAKSIKELEEKFDKSIDEIKGMMLKMMEQPKAAAVDAAKTVAEVKSVYEASSDLVDTNPRYDAKAREILGEKVKRTYMTFPKGGGTLFTIVVDTKFSNAPKDYLERYKEDRRTVNIEREEFRGEDGVEKWAKLVLQNLSKTLR